MRFYRQGVLALLSAATLLCGLTACSGSDNSPSPEDSGSSSASVQKTNTAPENLPSATTTVIARDNGDNPGTPDNPTPIKVDAPIQISRPQNQPWLPGTMFGIQPNSMGGSTVSWCTAAFSFTAPDFTGQLPSRAYAVTAGHCGQNGDYVYYLDKVKMEVDFGRPVGQFIYSSMLPYQDQTQRDWALIEITDPQAQLFHPEPNIQANLPSTAPLAPLEVCKWGANTNETCGTLPLTETHTESYTMDGGLKPVIENMAASLCTRPGDSGGPVYSTIHGQEMIVGLISTTINPSGSCNSSAEQSGITPLWDILGYLQQMWPTAYFDRAVY